MGLWDRDFGGRGVKKILDHIKMKPLSKKRLTVKLSAIEPQFRVKTKNKSRSRTKSVKLNWSLLGKPFTLGKLSSTQAQGKSTMKPTTTLTKLELVRTLRKKYISLGHGTYESHDYFVVPKNVVIIFVSRSSRYLPQSVVSPEFYNYFGKSDRNYSNRNVNVPEILEGRYERIYGPGEQVANLSLDFNDPDWPGMGLHRLPIAQGTFKTDPGKYVGMKGNLKQLVEEGPGVYFIVSCRAIVYPRKQPYDQKNQSRTVKYFLPSAITLGGQVQAQNEISQSLRKRRRISPGISRTKKPKTVMNDLISRFSTALRL